MRGLLWQVRQEMSVLHGKLGGKQGLRRSNKSCTRKEHESATNSIAKRGQGAIAPCRVKGQRPLWGLGQRPNSSASNLLKGRSQQGAGSEASLPVTLRVRRRAPKLLFPPRFRDEQKCRTLCTTLCITKENGQYQQTYPQNRAKNADLVNSVCITDEKLPKDTG